jgi:hypothetical protein
MWDMEPPKTDATAALDAFTLAVMASCGQLSLIIDHMHRFAAEAGPDADAEPVPVVLHQLLRDVLHSFAAEHDVADLATAAQLLDSATRTIGDELFFVDLSRLQGDD